MSKLNNIILKTFKISADKLSDQTGPESVENWDSIGHLHLVSAIENEFGIELSMEQVEKMQNVGMIKQLLSELGVKDF